MSLVALVLAAGSARRFGSDKQSTLFAGEPLLNHAIRAACAAPVEGVIVMTRPGFDIGTWPAGSPVQSIPITSDSLSTSLKAGIAAISPKAAGAFVFLGDMPRIPHDIAGKLASRLGDAYAAMPRQGERHGHPVLLSRRAFADIAKLSGDEGAGRLLRNRNDVIYVDCESPLIHADVDRPEDISRLSGH